MRFTVIISNSRIPMMQTFNGTNADLGAALDDGSSTIQTGATLESTNLAYHQAPAGVGILAKCPGGWWFYSPGVGQEYFAVKDSTNDMRTTIADPTRLDIIRVVIRDYKKNHPTPSPAIEDIGAVLATAIKAAAAPVVHPVETWMKEMNEKMVAQHQMMMQQMMVVARPEPGPPAVEQQVVAVVPRPPPPPPVVGRGVGWAEVSMVLIATVGLCFISYLVITKPPAPVSTALVPIAPQLPVNHRYNMRYDRTEEEDSFGGRYSRDRVVKEVHHATETAPAATASMPWWKIVAFTLVCALVCNSVVGASRSQDHLVENHRYPDDQYYENDHYYYTE